MLKNTDRRRFLINSLGATALLTKSDWEAALASTGKQKYRVAIIGCGRLGQHYAEIYRALPDTELVAIAEWNAERRKAVGERFGITALYQDAPALLKDVVPDIAAVITPTKYMKEAVIACAQAGVKAVQTDRPHAARLSDADEMVEVCKRRGVVFAGGGMERGNWEVQEAARRLRLGEFGKPQGVAVHGYEGEILSGGADRILILSLFTNAEVDEVIAWGSPAEALRDEATDEGLRINARFHLTSGMECQVFGSEGPPPYRGVEVWTEGGLVRWDRHGEPLVQVFRGVDAKGKRKALDPNYAPWAWAETSRQMTTLLWRLGYRGSETNYLLGPICSLLDALRAGKEPWITGHDMRHALEVAIACKRSAQLGNAIVKLPLEDRSLALYPRPYRWLGGDVSGRPQSAKEAAGEIQ